MATSTKRLTFFRRWAAANRGFMAASLIFLTGLLYMLFSADFYVLLLSRADFINQYVIATNVNETRELTGKLEENFDFEALYQEKDDIETAILEANEQYEAIFREKDYKRLRAEKTYWRQVTYQEIRDQYATFEEFQTARTENSTEIDRQIKEIQAARIERARELNEITQQLRDLDVKLKQIKTKTKVAQNKSERLIQDTKGTLSSTIFKDLEIVAPQMSEALNEYFFKGPVRKEITRFIDFLTDYEGLQKHYYHNPRADINATGSRNRLKIPEFNVDLRVATGPGGTGIKKHITAEVFSEIIHNDPTLQNRQLLIDSFKFTQSNLFEVFASDFSRDYNLSFKKNSIVFNSIRLSDAKDTKLAENIILLLTYVRKYFFILPLIALVVLMFNFIGSHKKERLAISLKMPFLIMALVYGLVALFGAYGYSYLYDGKHSYAVVQTVHNALTGGLQVIFGIPALIFLIIYFFGRWLSKNTAQKPKEAE